MFNQIWHRCISKTCENHNKNRNTFTNKQMTLELMTFVTISYHTPHYHTIRSNGIEPFVQEQQHHRVKLSMSLVL